MTNKELSPEQLILLTIKACGGKINGKTLLQKRIYFISTVMDIELDYKAHYYGPYSPEIDEGTSCCKALGFIVEQKQGFGVHDPVGFEVRRYDYSLSSDGEQIFDQMINDFPKEWNDIKKLIKNMKEAGDTGDYVVLSIAAKTHFILDKQKMPMTVSEIVEKAKSLGWNINDEQINKASDFLNKLKLVELN